MKRFDPKNKYLGWGITAFGVIACSILFFMLLQHGKSIGDAISSLLGILSPIIWGLVIAYLLWPLTKVFQRKLFEPLLKKIRPKNRCAPRLHAACPLCSQFWSRCLSSPPSSGSSSRRSTRAWRASCSIRRITMTRSPAGSTSSLRTTPRWRKCSSPQPETCRTACSTGRRLRCCRPWARWSRA